MLRRLILYFVQVLFLSVKLMAADGAVIGPAGGYPGPGGQGGSVEIRLSPTGAAPSRQSLAASTAESVGWS